MGRERPRRIISKARLRTVAPSPDDGRARAPGRLAAKGLVLGLWSAAALAAGAWISFDRYPLSYILWTVPLSMALLGALLALLGLLARIVPRRAAGPLLPALLLLLPVALGLDLRAFLFDGPRGHLAYVLALLGCCAVVFLQAWREKRCRLPVSACFLTLLLGWVVVAWLRGLPSPARSLAPFLMPLCLVILSALGIPRLDAVLRGWRAAVSALACLVLAGLPFVRHDLLPPLASPMSSPSPASERSALLIVFDTLRKDHLSLHGYHRRTMPNLDRWASRGMVYDEATSVSSWTLPAHASMFTGLYPRSHGAHGLRSEVRLLLDAYPLAPERDTLAELALRAGYRTVGLASNHSYVSRRVGCDQGFQDFWSEKPRTGGMVLDTIRALVSRWSPRAAQFAEMPYVVAPDITRAAISWLRRRGDRPFFMFLNYMEPHSPNAPPGSQGLPFEDETPLTESEKTRILLGGDISDSERRGMDNEYDRDLIYLDRSIGELFDYLERSGLMSRTLVIATSDHGEYHGEHHLVGHSKDLYDEAVGVPLIVWEPGGPVGRSSRPVQCVDIFPTILEALRLPVPPGTQGQPLGSSSHPIVSELYYTRHMDLCGTPYGRRFDRIIRTIRLGTFRYFEATNGERRLFDLAADPGETNDLVHVRPDVALRAEQSLREWLAMAPAASQAAVPPQEADEETLRGLRSLGYLR